MITAGVSFRIGNYYEDSSRVTTIQCGYVGFKDKLSVEGKNVFSRNYVTILESRIRFYMMWFLNVIMNAIKTLFVRISAILTFSGIIDIDQAPTVGEETFVCRL